MEYDHDAPRALDPQRPEVGQAEGHPGPLQLPEEFRAEPGGVAHLQDGPQPRHQVLGHQDGAGAEELLQ